MKTPKAGLVCAGGVSKSFLARMPALLRTIGPLKATSFRVARRIANSLRAGHPIEDYQELRGASPILVALPEAALHRVLGELSTESSLAGQMIVVCGTARDSSRLKNCAATLDAIPGDEGTLVAEGDPAALRQLRRAAAADRRKLIEIPNGAKPCFLGGVRLASDLLLANFSAGVELLRAAGFSRAQATHIAEGLGRRALRAYAKAGRKAWSTAVALDLEASREHDLAPIRSADPVRASLYERAIQQALDYFKP